MLKFKQKLSFSEKNKRLILEPFKLINYIKLLMFLIKISHEILSLQIGNLIREMVIQMEFESLNLYMKFKLLINKILKNKKLQNHIFFLNNFKILYFKT